MKSMRSAMPTPDRISASSWRTVSWLRSLLLCILVLVISVIWRPRARADTPVSSIADSFPVHVWVIPGVVGVVWYWRYGREYSWDGWIAKTDSTLLCCLHSSGCLVLYWRCCISLPLFSFSLLCQATVAERVPWMPVCHSKCSGWDVPACCVVSWRSTEIPRRWVSSVFSLVSFVLSCVLSWVVPCLVVWCGMS